MRARGGINKPSYYAHGLLHQLGTERLANSSHNAIVTKNKDGSIVIATWNLVDPGDKGESKKITFSFSGLPQSAHATLQRVDSEHGNVLKEYAAMGSPHDPTMLQIEQLNRKTALPAPETSQLQNNKLDVQLSPNALVLITIRP